ncbi:unnamed protein product [Danaus chrysippus]|uniref:(African queen) hypothetical protein n=1 Tax=Danaus chrysippus TaxID=151541 RepID=A0A8J2R594_9NEOP|nr:unnamed protein product [Danaus chrysippus]
MSVGRDIVLAAVRVVDRDIARVVVLMPQLITAGQFEVTAVRELVIRRVMIVYATVIATTIGRGPRAFKIPRIVTCNTTDGELNTSQSNVSRCCTPEPQASTHDTRTKNCLPNTRTFTPQRNERNVNLCAENNSKNTGASDIVVVVVDGIPMDAIIDSGALNVSLISSDVLRYLASQPKSTNCVLKGISEKEIVVKAYVTVTLELSQISIEANLLIVPSSCMNAPIIAGTDILNRDGIMYIRTKDDQYLTRSTVSPIQINTVRCLEINTPLKGVMNRCLKS